MLDRLQRWARRRHAFWQRRSAAAERRLAELRDARDEFPDDGEIYRETGDPAVDDFSDFDDDVLQTIDTTNVVALHDCDPLITAILASEAQQTRADPLYAVAGGMMMPGGQLALGHDAAGKQLILWSQGMDVDDVLRALRRAELTLLTQLDDED